MFCNKTNVARVTLHKFPTAKTLHQQWIPFVHQKTEPDSWKPGLGHICSDHLTPKDYHAFGMKLAGITSKLLLVSNAIPSRQVATSPEQLQTVHSKKCKLQPSERRSEEACPEECTTPKRQSRALSKLTGGRVGTVWYFYLNVREVTMHFILQFQFCRFCHVFIYFRFLELVK